MKKSIPSFVATLVAVSTSLTLGSPAFGAYSNYNSVLLGERAAGLGGAFTALAGDTAAIPYYNPATAVLMDASSLSATVNVYNKYDTRIGTTGDLIDASQRVNRGFFRSLPSSSGTILRFPSFAFGLSILVPDYEFFSGQLKNTENTDAFLSLIDESLWVGGTFAVKLTNRDSLGLSLYYTARNLARSVNDRRTLVDASGNATGAVITSEEKNLTANSVVPIFGYHRKLSETWSVGASYRPPSLPIAGEASYNRAVTRTTPYDSQVISRDQMRALTKIPARIGLGVAREVKGKNTLSVDVQINEGLSYRDLPELLEGAEQIDHRQVSNLAIGFEQTLSSWAIVRLGYFTNLSSHPVPDVSTGLRQGDHVDMYGFSANVNIRTEQKTLFTIGGYYNGGSGVTTQIVGESLRLLPKTQRVFTMLVATGFDF